MKTFTWQIQGIMIQLTGGKQQAIKKKILNNAWHTQGIMVKLTGSKATEYVGEIKKIKKTLDKRKKLWYN